MSTQTEKKILLYSKKEIEIITKKINKNIRLQEIANTHPPRFKRKCSAVYEKARHIKKKIENNDSISSKIKNKDKIILDKGVEIPENINIDFPTLKRVIYTDHIRTYFK